MTARPPPARGGLARVHRSRGGLRLTAACAGRTSPRPSTTSGLTTGSGMPRSGGLRELGRRRPSGPAGETAGHERDRRPRDQRFGVRVDDDGHRVRRADPCPWCGGCGGGWSRMAPTTPAAAHLAMKPYTVRQGVREVFGQSPPQPESTRCRMASTISRRGCFSGLPGRAGNRHVTAWTAPSASAVTRREPRRASPPRPSAPLFSRRRGRDVSS